MLHRLAKDRYVANEARSWRQVEMESKNIVSKTFCTAEY